MELTPLRYTLAIAEVGHMTRAAQALGVTQPTLSAMLKKLEAELGAPLFDRTGRGVEPTEAGRAFLEQAALAVRAADRAFETVQELVGLEHGSIRIGGGATAMGELLPAAVGRVRKDHPALRFSIREAGSASVAASVLAGELDMGIVTQPVSVPGSGDLLTVATVEDELRLILPPEHPLATETGFRWEDLRHEPVVAFEAGSAVREVIDAAAEAAGVPLDVVVELRSIASIRRMVAAGVGVGFVSRFALDRPVEGKGGTDPVEAGLACVDTPLVRTLAVVRRSDRIPSHAAAAFERALLDVIGSRTGEVG